MSILKKNILRKSLRKLAVYARSELPLFVAGTAGMTLLALAVVLLIMPNRFPDLGVNGIAVLSNYIWGISPIWIIGSVNFLLLLWGWRVLSPRFAIWTTYNVVLFTILLKLFERIPVPPLDDRFMIAVVAGVLKGVALGLIYSQGISSGGTDIPGMVLRKRFGIEMGQFNIYINFAILFLSFFVVGLEAVIYGMVSVYTMGIVSDSTLRSFNRRKQVFIITRNPQDVSKFIMKDLNRGVTLLHGRGGYTGQERAVLVAFLAPRQTAFLKNYLSSLDPHAFMAVSDASEVVGKGFKPWKSL